MEYRVLPVEGGGQLTYREENFSDVLRLAGEDLFIQYNERRP